MKKAWFLSLALALTLTACGGSQMNTPAGSASPEGNAPQKQDVSVGAADAEAAKTTFASVLWDACQQGRLPDGTELDCAGGPEGIAQNEFALFDADGDGREELLLNWSNACMAGMSTYIWDYADGALHQELTAFPALIFYDHGVIQEDWSHNQGWAGRFWPYFLHVYDPETDTYETAGAVDAWDITCRPDSFPADKDQDGDGLLYFLLLTDEDWDRLYGADDGSVVEAAVDGPAYEAWRDSILQDGQPVEIPWLPLTQENISSALGCPAPDAPASEPAG